MESDSSVITKYVLIELYQDIEISRIYLTNLKKAVKEVLNKKDNKGYILLSHDFEVVYIFRNIKNSTVTTYLKSITTEQPS